MATKCSSGLQQQQDCPKPKRYTGHIRDTPDHRDLIREYGSREIPSTDDHPMVDLRKYVHKVYEQGNLQSCTGNVVCAAYSLVLNIQADKVNLPYSTFDPSRLFVYYNTRSIFNDVAKDTGAPLRNALKAIHRYGVCEELEWPYDERKFAQRPSFSCYTEAAGNKIYKYVQLRQNIDQFRACLKEGFPFTLGFEIYDSFDNMVGAYMPLPSDQEIQSTPNPDTHSSLVVGYDDRTQLVTILNSWGEKYGDNGYFYMPYKYITTPERAFDFWKIEQVSETL